MSYSCGGEMKWSNIERWNCAVLQRLIKQTNKLHYLRTHTL